MRLPDLSPEKVQELLDKAIVTLTLVGLSAGFYGIADSIHHNYKHIRAGEPMHDRKIACPNDSHTLKIEGFQTKSERLKNFENRK